MGQIMVKYYDFARENGGLPVLMKLAMKTTVPSTRAVELPDSPEAIAKIKAALKEILPDKAIPDLN